MTQLKDLIRLYLLKQVILISISFQEKVKTMSLILKKISSNLIYE